MARKKAGQKRQPTGQAPQQPAGDLWEGLLGELMNQEASPDEMLFSGEVPESVAADAPELLAALSSSVESNSPEAETVELAGVPLAGYEPDASEMPTPDFDSADALAAMHSAVELESLPVIEAAETATGENIEASESPTPEETLASESEFASQQIAEATSNEDSQSPQDSKRSLQPAATALTPDEPKTIAEEIAAIIEDQTQEEPDVTIAIPASIPRSVMPERREEEQPQEQSVDVLSQMVAGIDSQIAAVPTRRQESFGTADAEGPVQAYAAFHLSGSVYAVAVGNIREIDRVTEITQVPNVPGFIRGVINIRGDVTCVLDLRTFIGLAPLENEESGWLLVVTGSDTRRTLALLVDEMSSLVRVTVSTLKPPTGKVEDRVIPLLAGVVEQRDRVLGVLSVDSLLGSPDVRQLWM